MRSPCCLSVCVSPLIYEAYENTSLSFCKPPPTCFVMRLMSLPCCLSVCALNFFVFCAVRIVKEAIISSQNFLFAYVSLAQFLSYHIFNPFGCVY
jgi:hypothetical protein